MARSRSSVLELDLPFTETVEGDLQLSRHRHLLGVPGLDEAAATRLEAAFPSLAALYAAPEEQLAAVVGPVTAARLRWFLDAPLRPGLPRRTTGWGRAA